jgi:hypothetical protein
MLEAPCRALGCAVCLQSVAATTIGQTPPRATSGRTAARERALIAKAPDGSNRQ